MSALQQRRRFGWIQEEFDFGNSCTEMEDKKKTIRVMKRYIRKVFDYVIMPFFLFLIYMLYMWLTDSVSSDKGLTSSEKMVGCALIVTYAEFLRSRQSKNEEKTKGADKQ